MIVSILQPGRKIFFCLAAVLYATIVPAQKIIPLYTDGIPNALPVPDEEYVDPASNQLMKVSRPTLTAYLPDRKKANGAAVIICPGGGYGSLVIYREGHDVAKVFTDKGIAAFVLKYRLPDSRTMKNRTIGPLQDAQQSIKLIRQRSKEFNVDPNMIGIMGYSAGGHLAATAGIRFSEALINNNEKINLRPDFMILVYPIISMTASVGHKGSTDNLLGPDPSDSLVQYFSNELHVTGRTSPAFIAYAADDQGTPNSTLLFDALYRSKVNAELHIYATGGHGFLKYPPVEEWMGRCFNWLTRSGWMKRKE